MNQREKLDELYEIALAEIAEDNLEHELNEALAENVELIAEKAESNKGIATVLVTLLVHKSLHPEQDIRYHQAQLQNGFAGRRIDTDYVTPFMKEKSFPAMSESGWLTRSLEQPHPYDLNYPGRITPTTIKKAFLETINSFQCENIDPEIILKYLIKLFIKQRDRQNIDLAKPHSLPIATIIAVLKRHFTYSYSCSGASRLPSLAVYAAYECMVAEVDRFGDKRLLPLASHNSADAQSGRIGDIDVANEDGTAYEGVEIKHEIVITRQHVSDAYEKFKVDNTNRYYLLTTADMTTAIWGSIEEEISRIMHIHGCQVIVDEVYDTLRYYLRLLKDPSDFIDKYVELLKNDETIKFEHKEKWNDIIGNL